MTLLLNGEQKEKQILKKMSWYFPGEGAQSFPQPCVEGRDCCTPVVSKF